MENETLIDGSMFFSIGFFTILIGFLLIMVGIALSLYQESRSMQSYSNRTDAHRKDSFFESTSNSESSLHEKPSERKVESEIKTGGVIMIGPIPIIFGSDKESAKTAAILAIVLMLLSLLILRTSFF
ncbi:TIGR00304 family membrane protein [Methanosarcina sp. UBA5]|uniref:TIGR00304 family membrane protein n=1 Tax=Methanosarcina sp. UBA5 TaxID=1915593 RepID=UPI0025E89F48|nr:TIGR00304 family protein [Methanosarcina sp. UBA5]